MFRGQVINGTHPASREKLASDLSKKYGSDSGTSSQHLNDFMECNTNHIIPSTICSQV